MWIYRKRAASPVPVSVLNSHGREPALIFTELEQTRFDARAVPTSMPYDAVRDTSGAPTCHRRDCSATPARLRRSASLPIRWGNGRSAAEISRMRARPRVGQVDRAQSDRSTCGSIYSG
jgi:hypothetical protein